MVRRGLEELGVSVLRQSLDPGARPPAPPLGYSGRRRCGNWRTDVSPWSPRCVQWWRCVRAKLYLSVSPALKNVAQFPPGRQGREELFAHPLAGFAGAGEAAFSGPSAEPPGNSFSAGNTARKRRGFTQRPFGAHHYSRRTQGGGQTFTRVCLSTTSSRRWSFESL